MSNLSIQLDGASSRELDKAIQRLAEVAGQTAEEVLTQQARLFCTDLAFITRPIGKSPADGKTHADKIEAKISEIYWTIGKAVNILKSEGKDGKAQAFQRMIRKNNFAAAAAIAQSAFKSPYSFKVGPFDGGELHRAERFRKNVRRVLICTDKAAITRYKAQEKRQSGFAKAGFATAARMLGGARGIPGFVTRHASAPGSGSVQKVGDQISVVIENRVDHVENAFDRRQEAMAIDARRGKITALIKRILTNKAKKASPSLK